MTNIIELVEYGNINELQLLKVKGELKVNITDSEEKGLITKCILSNAIISDIIRLNIIKFLIDNNTPIDQFDNKNKTPLYYAILNHKHDIITLLLQKRANYTYINKIGQNPLFACILFETYKMNKPMLKDIFYKSLDTTIPTTEIIETIQTDNEIKNIVEILKKCKDSLYFKNIKKKLLIEFQEKEKKNINNIESDQEQNLNEFYKQLNNFYLNSELMLTEYNDNLFYIKLISLSIIESLVKFSKFYRNLNDSNDFQFPFEFMFNVLFSDKYIYNNLNTLNMNGENRPTHIYFNFYNVQLFINENYFLNKKLKLILLIF